MFRKTVRALPRLPFPTKRVGNNKDDAEYIIPEEERGRVLDSLYPFEPVPGLDEKMLDIHEDKVFEVREFRVFRGKDMDLLVSPYFPESGGTVIDWVPFDLKPGEIIERKIRGEPFSVLTVRLAPTRTCH